MDMRAWAGVWILAAAGVASAARVEGWKWAAYGLPESERATCIPATRGADDSWWIPYFQEKLKQPRKDLLFLGDSITDLWTYPADGQYPGGLNTWNERYRAIATNYGVTGDKTQTVLWRLTEGKSLEGYRPKQIVLLIGINNLLQGDTPEDTAAGIEAIVRHLRRQLPDSRVLLLGLFPSGEKPTDPIRRAIRDVNRRIAKLADSKTVFFADLGDRFPERDGTIRRDVMRDYLHLSPEGYERWADALDPLLQSCFRLDRAGRGPGDRGGANGRN